MRIAILADPIDNQNAGIHVFTKEMVDALIRTNPGYEILLIREKVDYNLKGVEQVAIWNTRLPIGFASLRLFLIVPFVLHFKKADIVVEPAHFGPFNLLKYIKRVTIIHDLTPILFPDFHRWHSQLLQKIFLKGILNNTDLIIANSDNTANDICKVYPQNCKKVKRIYPGKTAQYKPENKVGVLKKYNITDPYFLFVGTIEPRKNLLILLDAFTIFKTQNKNNVKLVITGGIGWKAEGFTSALNVHSFKDSIHCTGFADAEDLPTLYTQAVALIYPSLYEGFGLPVIEAMSCGTPVITGNNSSLPEAGGDAALYFDASDSAALAVQMEKIFSDKTLRNQLSKKALKHVQKFDWDDFATEAWNVLDDLKQK